MADAAGTSRLRVRRPLVLSALAIAVLAVCLVLGLPSLRVPHAKIRAARDHLAAGADEVAEALFTAILAERDRLSESDRIEALTERARARVNLGRVTEALADLNEALLLDPQAPEALALRGTLLFRMGDPRAAAVDLAAAVRAGTSTPDTVNNYGAALIALGRLDEAEPQLLEVERLDPTNWRPHFNLGRIHEERTDLVTAESRFMTALTLAPSEADIYFHLGRTRTKQGRHDAALETFDGGIKVAPRDAKLQLGRAGVLFQSNRFDEALDACDLGLSADDTLWYGYFVRGACNEQLGRFGAAASDLSRCLELRPGRIPTMIVLADILDRLGKEEESAALVRRAHEISPSDVADALTSRPVSRRERLSSFIQ